MAADLGCCGETVRNMAKREGWVRYEPPPRDLSPAARLRARAEGLAEHGTASRSLPPCGGGLGRGVAVGEHAASTTTTPTPDPSPQGGGEEESSPPPDNGREATVGDLPPPGGGEEREAGGGEEKNAAGASDPAIIASQMLHEVAGFLDDVRAERKRMKRAGYAKHELQAVSRVIADLSASLGRLQPMAQRAAEPDSGIPYDDMPADLDDFRDELARRIEALLDEPPGEGDRAAAAAAGAAASQP